MDNAREKRGKNQKQIRAFFPANLAETVLRPSALNYVGYLLPQRSSEVKSRRSVHRYTSYSLRGKVEGQWLMSGTYKTSAADENLKNEEKLFSPE